MRKTAVYFIILVFVAGMLLTGCQTQKEEEPVEITIVSGWGGTFQSHKVMREIYEEFDRRNQDIVLNCIPYSDNVIAVEKSIDMLAVGNAPDIVSTNGLSYYLEQAVKCGEALDLMPYIEADPEWKKQIHPSVFDIWLTEDGELYTLQDALEVAGYWYNEAYLIEAGVVDENGNAAVPKTWTEFMEMTDKLQEWITNQQRDISVFALEEDQMKVSFFFARLAGDSEEGLKAATSSDPVLDEALLQNTLSDLRHLRQYSKDVYNIEEARKIFSDGKSVIYFGGVWEADELEKSDRKEQFQFADYPTNNGKSLSYVSPSSGYVISKQSDKRKTEACIRFLKYIGSQEVQERIALMTNQAPSNPCVDMEQIAEENKLLGKALEVAYAADIQIATIYSVWDESQIKMIEDIIYDR
ncbi:MAG: ABC transporter substrate-binding protein [Lachnospiraceae bacterium]